MTDRSGWTQRRLQETEAYLRHVMAEGERKIYDAEEHQLLLIEVQEEITRRRSIPESAGGWVFPLRCPCDGVRVRKPGYKLCAGCLEVAGANGIDTDLYRQ